MKLSYIKALILLFVCQIIPLTLSAAVPSLLGIEPGLIGRTLTNSPTLFTPKKTVDFEQTPEQPATPLTGEASRLSFVLTQVIISGNHAISTSTLQTLARPLLQRKITLAQLQKLVDEITDQYQKKGYFLSKAFLPPQQIQQGVVKITVVEGFISSVQIKGLDNPKLIAFIEKYNRRIESHQPINLADLERYLLLISDVSGFDVKSVLAPDPKVPLGSVLTLITDYTPFQATMTADNFQTRYLGPRENTFYSSLNSVFLPGGTFYGRALSANHFSQLNYFELRHDQTIGIDGLVFSLDGYITETNPQFILAPLDVFGYSGDANTGLFYPIIRSRSRSLNLQAQFDYMNNSSFVLGQQLYKDHIRDLSITAQYTDVLGRGEDSAMFILDKGLPIFNANNNHDFHSRAGVTPDFLKLILTLSRSQYINERFSLYALVTSQYANVPLYAAETMIFGGPFIGRGYDWAQFTGDKGVAGKAEFRVNTAPDFPFLKQVQYYAFYDVGQLFSLIPQVQPVSGASVGLGLRAMVVKHLNAEGFIGKPLTTPNATQVILGESGHQFQGYFQITAYL